MSENADYMASVQAKFDLLKQEYINARTGKSARAKVLATINLLEFFATFKAVNAICFDNQYSKESEFYKRHVDFAVKYLLDNAK